MRTGTGSARARLPRVPLAVVLAALAAPAAAAEVALQARVDRSEIAQDDVVTQEIRLESPEPPSRWNLPAGPDFEVVHEARSQDQAISIDPGAGVRIRTAYGVTRVLRPRRAGALTLPSVSAVVRGREYVTQPLVVQVSAGGASPRPPAPGGPAAPGPRAQPTPRGGWAYPNLRKDISLRAQVDRREVWLGEQLTVAFRILTPYPMQAYGNGTAPRLEGFWQEVMETPRVPVAEPQGDRLAYLVHRVALFPSRTGPLTIDPLQLRDVTVPVRGGGFGLFGSAVQVDLKSDPIPVRVKPLPPDPPAGFDPSNVGTLALDVQISPERVAVGEPVTVRITVSGDGNVRAITPPRLPDVPGARAFAPTASDRTEERRGRLHGTRTTETVLVPDRAGELVVPGLEWPYFDPRAGKYQVILTPAQRVTVLPAAAAAAPRAGVAGEAEPGGRLRAIRADGSLRRAGAPAWEQPWFLALLALPPLAFGAALLAERLRAADRGPRAARAAGRRARRRLLGARRSLERDPAAAAGEVERALLGYAAGRLGRPAAGMTRQELAAALSRAGAHPPALRAFLLALERVDAARYGAGDAHGEEVLTAAETALTALDEADWEPDREVGS